MASIIIHPYWYYSNGIAGYADTRMNISKSEYEARYNGLVDFFLKNEPRLLPVLQDLMDNNALLMSLQDGPFRMAQPVLPNEVQPHIMADLKYTVADLLKRGWEFLRSNPTGILAMGMANLTVVVAVNRLMAERLNEADKKYIIGILSKQNPDEDKKRLYLGLYGFELNNPAGGHWTGDIAVKRWDVYNELRGMYQNVPANNKW